MLLIFLWLIGIPKLLYHFFLTSVLMVLFLCYKVFGAQQVDRLSHLQVQEQLHRRQRMLLVEGGHLRDRIKSALMRGASGAMNQFQKDNALREIELQDGKSFKHLDGNVNREGCCKSGHQFHLANLALIYVILVASCWPSTIHCLEQREDFLINHLIHFLMIKNGHILTFVDKDAAIIEPVANIAKSLIKTVTLGVPLELNFDPAGLVKNFAYFTWRTRFPVSMPRGFVQKAQDFYNRARTRVEQTEVADVQRKSLANLKIDLDAIVDSIVEEVRRSPDGLYTDYLQTSVNGVQLEDACTAVGVQLKAYGVDLTNYRNIAGMVLGIPVMPTVASAMVNVASLANIGTMRNLTSSLNPLNSTRFLTQLPNTAAQSVSMVSNSLGTLRQQLPMQNFVQAPMSLLTSGQRIFAPQVADQQRQPVFA